MTFQDDAVAKGDSLELTPRPVSDALLQASRRMDWRFLLPDPRLERVACIGPLHRTMLESLQQFSGSVSIFETLDGSGELYDVVVVCDPSRERLRAALSAVKPGGMLYAEFAGQRYRPRRYAAVIERAGYASVEFYWHWPNIEGCTKIIPLHDPSVLQFALVKGKVGIIPRFERVLVRWLYRTGLLGLGIRHFSLVAQRGDV